MSLEKTTGTHEFEGPDFSMDCLSSVRYRSHSTAEIEYKESRLQTPARLEVQRESGWQQHPVIFRYNGGYEGSNGVLVIFLANGKYITQPCQSEDNEFLERAKEKGLTQGQVGIQRVVREG